MKRFFIGILIICAFWYLSCNQQEKAKPQNNQQNWTHFVRIAGHGLNINSIDDIIKSATETHVFGIEVDNSLTGYYESFLDPQEKLKAIDSLAKRAHDIGNYAFIYTEGLETITSDANNKEHTFFKDHPDWVQRDRDGRPAVFGGGDAFWISEGDEDVWISPYAQEWRKLYMERIRQIAATGINGIFIDIPYWMIHFDGWEDTWASFDEYTVAAFKEKTGIDAQKDFELGDFSDTNFIKWVDFRIESLTDFMADVNKNAKSVNPECKVIAEIYPGIEEAAVRVGADVYEMYQVVDVIAHEYSGGRGNAASKNPLDWFSRMTGMYSFRAFADGKASWMLSYSWGNEEKIEPADAMENLALSNVMAGTNTWDARGHVMSRSNDIEARKRIFKWIADNEKVFYLPRQPINPVGVYFSPKTRNYFADEFMASYKGVMYLMLQSHHEFQVVTPRTLADFSGNVLILPDVRCIGAEEVQSLKTFINEGNALLVTGNSGEFNLSREKNELNPILSIFTDIAEAETKESFDSDYGAFRKNCPGKQYSMTCQSEYDRSAWAGNYEKTTFHSFLKKFNNLLTNVLGYKPQIDIEASPFISTQVATVADKPHVFIANFKGLKRKENARQLPETGVKISFPAKENASVFFLPFLGNVSKLETKMENGKIVCTLPELSRGAVVWID